MALKPVIAGMFYRSESGALKPLIAGMAVQNGTLKPLIAGFLYQSGGGDIPVSGSGTIEGYSSAAAPPAELAVQFLGSSVALALSTGIVFTLSYDYIGSPEDRVFSLSTVDPGGGVIWLDSSGVGSNGDLAELLSDGINGQSLSELTATFGASLVTVTSAGLGSTTTLGGSSSTIPSNVSISGGGSGTDLSGEITDAEVIPASVGSFISLETAVITTNALGFESEWELYWSPEDVVLFTSTPPTDPNLSSSDIFGELAETVSPLSNSLRARITGAIPDAPQQIVTIAASGILAPPGTFAEIQFPSGDEFAQSGSSDFVRLYLGSSVGSASHVFWGQAGTSVEPTGLTGTITFHELSVDGLEADEVRDLFCQAIVNTGLWTIPGFTQQTAPVNTVPPVIDDETPGDGDTITTTNGTWTMTPTSYTYQWFADAVEIVGATSNSYEVEEAEGVELTCEVTAHNSVGSSDPELTSNVATVVAGAVWSDTFSSASGNATSAQSEVSEVAALTCATTGDCTTLRAYIGEYNFDTNIKCALYDASDNLLGSGAATPATGSTNTYLEIALNSPVPVTASTTYKILFIAATAGMKFKIVDPQASGTSHWDFTTSFASVPADPWVDNGGLPWGMVYGMLVQP